MRLPDWTWWTWWMAYRYYPRREYDRSGNDNYARRLAIAPSAGELSNAGPSLNFYHVGSLNIRT